MGINSVEKVAILGFPGQSIEDFRRVVTFERTFGAPQEQILDFPVPNCPKSWKSINFESKVGNRTRFWSFLQGRLAFQRFDSVPDVESQRTVVEWAKTASKKWQFSDFLGRASRIFGASALSGGLLRMFEDF